MEYFIQLTLLAGAIIHVLPLVGIMGERRLAALYGVKTSDPNLLVLMRHRALLFGLLGVFLVYAAVEPRLQFAGLVGGLISLAGYLGLYSMTVGMNRQLRRVAFIDAVALVFFMLALALKLGLIIAQK